ncbi:MAG TPA: SwmB domain-containing protein [Bryobacteraceae bacterium]|nr:SwmB domain-containing protein [Bryobacteraceae bacterium]
MWIKHLLLLALTTIPTFAATLYCGVGASGSGANFANLAALPTTLSTAGNTYVLTPGSGYPVFTVTAANVTVRVAQAALDSGVTGWNSSYDTGKAVFVSAGDGINFTGATDNTGAFTFSGGSAARRGIKVSFASGQGINFNNGGALSVVEYIEFGGPGGDADYFYPSSVSGISAWGDEAKGAIYRGNEVYGCDTLIDASCDNQIIEHNYLHGSRSTNPDVHSNVYLFSGPVTNITFRWNKLRNYNAEGILLTAFAGNPSKVYIYGNDAASATGDLPRFLEIRQDYSFTNIYAWNNTGVDLSGGFILNRTTETGGQCKDCGATNNIGVNAGSTYTGMNASNNTEGSDESIFTDYASGDFTLAAALAGVAGDTAGDYDLDMLGNTRGADGTWDRGAYEYVSGGGDVTAPTLSSATIGTGGTSITLAFNETVTMGGGGSSGFTVSLSGGAATLSYSSGSGTSSLVYTISRTVYQGETGTISYTQPGNGVEDSSGNDLATFSGTSLTNSSTQQSGGGSPSASGTVRATTARVGTLRGVQ